MTNTMGKALKTFKIIATILVLGITGSLIAEEQSVTLWPRNDQAYLVREYSMPVWVELSSELFDGKSKVELTLDMPAGFELAGHGTSAEFAVHPQPLLVPKTVSREAKQDRCVVKMPIVFAKANESGDNLKYAEGEKKMLRTALLVNPGSSETGEYDVNAVLTVDGKQISTNAMKFVVLPKLQNKSPERLRVEAFDYAGYTDPTFKEAICQAVQGSGINVLTNMRLYEQDDTVAQLLRNKGVKPSLIIFWHNIMPVLAAEFPEVYPIGKDGNRITQPNFLLKNNICHTWILQNKEKVKPLLKKFFQDKVLNRYTAVTNDNEESAIARDKTYIRGDIYTPITMQAFKEFAHIDAAEELTPEIILEKYSEKWVDFRCWQSAQMSALLSDVLFELDASVEYGYYSGHKYVGNLAGFTRNMYATDWGLLAKEGGIQFGSSGYYGSTDDYTATTETLGVIPHIPAEMYIENFLDKHRAMPEPENFSYRLMNSLMYGSGGFAVWYLQVLDGAGYYAVSNISAIAAEIEDYLLDGEDCESELVVRSIPAIDSNAVFAYQLGQKRLVVFMNHSGKPKQIKYKWKTPIRKPDTVEIVSGKQYAAAESIDIELAPKSYAVFVTLSQGN